MRDFGKALESLGTGGGPETPRASGGGYYPHSIAAFGPGVRTDERSWKLQAGTYRLICLAARLCDRRWLAKAGGWFRAAGPAGTTTPDQDGKVS
jgi:hypothetical protein